MKTKIYFLTSVLLSVLLMACGNKSTAEKEKANEKEIDTHTAQNSLDWQGIYKGLLPCADCEGIETSLSLQDDLSYTLRTKYSGKDETANEVSGKFEWNTNGNTITLNGINPQEQPSQYFVGENKLIQLDLEGKKIEGELASNYELAKIISDNAIVDKYWKLTELNGKAVVVEKGQREAFLILDSAKKRVSGNGSCNGFFGQFELDETTNRISFSKMGATQKACLNMEIEKHFMEMLTTVDNYSLNGDRLTLNKARMAPLAVFEAVYVY